MIDICTRLYNAYKNPSIKSTRGRSGVYPSQASIETETEVIGACHRQQYFSWFDYDYSEPGNPDWSLAATMGEWIHTGVVNELKNLVYDTGLIVLSAEQSFFNKKHLVSGRTDIFLMDRATEEIFGVDIKSVGEWAGKRAMKQPRLHDILQCAVYLWDYQNTAAKGYRKIDEWIILYVSRDENWDLKKYIHGSKFKYMWQYALSFCPDGYIVVEDQKGTLTSYRDITIQNILDRYEKLLEYIKRKELPPRDFEAQYNEDKITALYKAGGLEYKKDQGAVEKWLKKGAIKGELKITMGDGACRLCSYLKLCYSDDPTLGKKKEHVLYRLPRIDVPTAVVEPPPGDSMF